MSRECLDGCDPGLFMGWPGGALSIEVFAGMHIAALMTLTACFPAMAAFIVGAWRKII